MPLHIPVRSSIYTPTFTANANLDSVTGHDAQFTRVESGIEVAGYVTVDPTAGANTSTSLYITLPLASDLQAVEDLCGTAACPTAFGLCAAIYADVSGNRALMQWNSQQTTALNLMFTFKYRIR